jgi:hypothetical protein
MRWPRTLLPALWALALPLWAAPAPAEKQTVCTITVNSDDEKETFRRYLPASRYRFVELVDPARANWLDSACRAAISCDVLIISGHYDGNNEFFSDRLETREFLPVDELERASCSGSCPALFSHLKEAYLFGCNTLNPDALSSATAEIVRSLVREGHSPKEAEKQFRALKAEHGESSRDRMRQIFKDVPVIYGFSAVAPLGPLAASTLGRFFRADGARDIGRGRVSSRLLGQFAPFSMSAARGLTDKDADADVRQEVCQFADDRLGDAERLEFIGSLLQREMAQVRVHLDRIQRYTAALGEPQRRQPAVAQALERIVQDSEARARYLAFTRDADQPEVRARMIKVATDLGWLTAEARWAELALMLGELQARQDVGINEVNLACTLNEDHELDGTFNRRVAPGGPADDAAHAAVRACLGSTQGLARTLDALVGSDDGDARIAQAYLRHRPIAQVSELRLLATRIAAMPESEAQVRALEALGRHYVSDRGVLEELVRLYSQTRSWAVQGAVAGILIRADRRSLARVELARGLVRDRLPSPPGENMIDALVRQLQTP